MKNKILKIFTGLLMFVLIIGSMGLYAYSEIDKTASLIDSCKYNGYDGIRYEKINYFMEKPRCAYFTDEERKSMEAKE